MALDDLLGKKESHESFGLLSLTRRSVGPHGTNLFGSSIRHNHVFVVSIHEAEKRRNHSEDRFFQDRELIEVEVSPAQLTEFITSPGVHPGVPCTIRRFNGESRNDCPEVDNREKIKKEFKGQIDKTLERANNLIVKIQEMATKSTVKKSDLKEVQQLATNIQTEILSNVPFVLDMFNESMEDTIKEAKGEVEAFFGSKVAQYGGEALKNELMGMLPTVPLLENKDTETGQT